MTLYDLQVRCYQQAKDKGWADFPVPIPEQVALICSEACEGLEAFREHQPTSWTDDDGKPQGIASEYADVLIRIGHYAELLGIDLEYEVTRKLEYNKTRPRRHGGKAA